MELLGMAAQHLAYVAYASEGISAGGRRYPRQKARGAGAAAGFPPPPDHPRRQRRQQDGSFGGGGDALVRPQGRGGGGGRNRLPRRLVWISKPPQPDFEAKEDRQTYGMSNDRIGFEQERI